jgi:hypothetical protein
MPEAVIVVTARTPSHMLNVEGGAMAVSHSFGMVIVLTARFHTSGRSRSGPSAVPVR